MQKAVDLWSFSFVIFGIALSKRILAWSDIFLFDVLFIVKPNAQIVLPKASSLIGSSISFLLQMLFIKFPFLS